MSGCDGRALARTQGAPIAEAIGVTEDAASVRPGRSDDITAARWLPLSIAAYLAALLAVDRYANYPEQLGLGVLTIAVLLAALTRVPVEVRAQSL